MTRVGHGTSWVARVQAGVGKERCGKNRASPSPRRCSCEPSGLAACVVSPHVSNRRGWRPFLAKGVAARQRLVRPERADVSPRTTDPEVVPSAVCFLTCGPCSRCSCWSSCSRSDFGGRRLPRWSDGWVARCQPARLISMRGWGGSVARSEGGQGAAELSEDTERRRSGGPQRPLTAREVQRQPMMVPGGPSEPGASLSCPRFGRGPVAGGLGVVEGLVLGVEGGLDGWVGVWGWELHLVVADCE